MRQDIQRASNYVLAVVLFAGMSTRLRATRLQQITLAVGCVVFLGTAIWLATSPVSVSV